MWNGNDTKSKKFWYRGYHTRPYDGLLKNLKLHFDTIESFLSSDERKIMLKIWLKSLNAKKKLKKWTLFLVVSVNRINTSTVLPVSKKSLVQFDKFFSLEWRKWLPTKTPIETESAFKFSPAKNLWWSLKNTTFFSPIF